MDPPSDAELRERAVSSEPCSTRPNPFDDSESSRKRRRTSLNGASRSRSVDTVKSAADPPSAADANDSTMNLDPADPTTPQTPDQSPRLSSPPPSGFASSRVTINLRSAQRALEPIPSSPLSSQSPTPGSRPALDNDVKASVEESEVEVDMPAVADTPALAGTPSPPIEVVDTEPDDDTDLETSQPGVTGLHGLHDSMLRDPARDFPYGNGTDTYQEMMAKLATYMTTRKLASPLAMSPGSIEY